MTSGNLYIGIDIGGTSINVGIVDDAGTPLAKQTRPSLLSQGLEAGLKQLDDAVAAIMSESGSDWDAVAAVGVAAPGTMDLPSGIIFHPFNLPGWEDLPLRKLVAERFGKPAILQNDANAAAYGEYWVGGASAAQSLMFWTLGTGIGGGIVIDGKLLTGAHSHGGECGHMIVQMDGGEPSPNHIHGALELYASALALVRRCEQSLANGRASVLAKWRAEGAELTPKLIARAAEEGDQLADELIMDTARYLAIGTINMMHTINPAVVLFGGAMTFGRNETELGRRFLARIKEVVKAHAFPILAERTVIEYATLGADAGFIGAAGCAREALLSDPKHPLPMSR
ncbi:MAG: ROK family protein [Planctomycetaceae bacterium]|nr:ROK family protein [Planctomycetaceae bacterium]